MEWHCPFKLIFGVPCPGCGTTRAIKYLFNGDIQRAFYTNPVGLLAFFVLCVVILVKGIDIIRGTNYTQTIFVRSFNNLRQRHFSLYIALIITCFVVAVLNGFWNYKKGL